MSLKIDGARDGVGFTKTTFPAGESCIRLTDKFTGVVMIEFDFESNGELFDLALLVDAIRRDSGKDIKELLLFMPYLPYARQDRVCNPGESLSVKVVADFINTLKFNRLCIMDPHSDVGAALLDRVEVTEQSFGAPKMAHLLDPENTIIVSPDAGAAKKALKFAKEGGFTEVVFADKVRELATGKIVATKVHSTTHVGTKDFLIVDDICDGGRTFIELAKELRKLTDGKVMLYVTHGIFSAGPKVFDGLIDAVYTSNPVGRTGNEAVESDAAVLV